MRNPSVKRSSRRVFDPMGTMPAARARFPVAKEREERNFEHTMPTLNREATRAGQMQEAGDGKGSMEEGGW